MAEPLLRSAPSPSEPVLFQLDRLRREFSVPADSTTSEVSPPVESAARSELERSLARQSVMAVALVMLLFGGLGTWAALTSIAGAVALNGVLTVDRGIQKVQHDEGGVVSEILARDGDRVAAGQVLVRLDGTSTRASLDIVEGQLRDAYAQMARLSAESSGGTVLTPSPDALQLSDDPSYSTQLVAQQQLMTARANARTQQAAQLRAQIEQTQQQIVGLEAQQVANAESLQISQKEEADIEGLFVKGLADASHLNDVKRSRVSLAGEAARLGAAIAEAKAQIAEREVQIASIDIEFRSSAMSDLETLRAKLGELLQQRIAARDRLERLDIKAPQGGVVSQSVVESIGGVVTAGETLMVVVPEQMAILVEARLSPYDVNNVRAGQSATLRFPSLDPRTTPSIESVVKDVSPDLLKDSVTGQSYYSVHLSVTPSERSRLPADFTPIPGTPVEAFARTGDRTVLSYLMQPITEQISRMLIEK